MRHFPSYSVVQLFGCSVHCLNIILEDVVKFLDEFNSSSIQFKFWVYFLEYSFWILCIVHGALNAKQLCNYLTVWMRMSHLNLSKIPLRCFFLFNFGNRKSFPYCLTVRIVIMSILCAFHCFHKWENLLWSRSTLNRYTSNVSNFKSTNIFAQRYWNGDPLIWMQNENNAHKITNMVCNFSRILFFGVESGTEIVCTGCKYWTPRRINISFCIFNNHIHNNLSAGDDP